MIKRIANHAGRETHQARAHMARPVRSMPVVRVCLMPYSSIDLPTRGAPRAMPANITVAVSPIKGVGTPLPSRITDETGRTIPNPKPAVNTAIRTAGSGLTCDFTDLLLF
jgi:hypothetical protein